MSEKGLHPQEPSIAKKAEGKVSPEFLEAVETSPFHVENKVAVLLTKAGLKPCSSIGEYVKIDDKVILSEDEVKNMETVVRDSGLFFDMNRDQKANEYPDGTKQIEDHIDIMVSASQEQLHTTKEITSSQPISSQGQEALGMSFGFPRTAIDAFIGKDGQKVLDKSTLPQEVKESEAFIFSPFMLSESHWQEELRQGQVWADCIKSISPSVYQEMMDAGKRMWREGGSQEKHREWQKVEAEFAEETDLLGYGIEKGIMGTVVGLNALGFNTVQSCEGHVDWGRIAPWVDVAAPDEPQAFNNEDAVYKNVADEFGLPLETVKRSIDKAGAKAWREAQKLLAAEGETAEHIAWRAKGREMAEKTAALVAEFNQGRDTPKSVRINVDLSSYDATIYNGGADYWSYEKKRTPQQKKNLERRLETYRAEFQAFAEFLKEKYFNQ